VERYENSYITAATGTPGVKEITIIGARYKNLERYFYSNKREKCCTFTALKHKFKITSDKRIH
jgi:hypothetical protein